jgi:hypothetical protein
MLQNCKVKIMYFVCFLLSFIFKKFLLFVDIKPPDQSTMTHGYLLRHASISAVDAATTLLTQAACQLLELEQHYIEVS